MRERNIGAKPTCGEGCAELLSRFARARAVFDVELALAVAAREEEPGHDHANEHDGDARGIGPLRTFEERLLGRIDDGLRVLRILAGDVFGATEALLE